MKIKLCIIGIFVLALAFCINCTKTSEWDDFQYPVLEYVDEDKVSEGAIIFNDLIDNPDSLFKGCILQVCKSLYRKKSEVPVKTSFKFRLVNTQGVAATGGDSVVIDMFLNSNYIASYYNSNEKDKNETLNEIVGIMIHELTHAYQHSPSGAGGYVVGSEYFSCVEGMADATRFITGYISPEFRRTGGHWNDGYKTTGFFIGWLMDKDGDFLYKFNQSAQTINPWSWDKVSTQIFGMTVSELWSQYQRSINSNGEVPVADFQNVSTGPFYTDSRILFKDMSTGDPYQWNWLLEGGIPSKSAIKNPGVIYKDPGVYSIRLAVKGPFGQDSIIRNEYIVIEKNPAGILFSDLGVSAMAQYHDSPKGEDVSKLFDNNYGSKFLTFNNLAWVQLKTMEKYRLKKYCIVSANDSPERDPETVVVQGSNDGENWVVIDERENVDFIDRFQTIDFEVFNSAAYSYYKIEFSNQEGNILQIADILLFGDTCV